MANEDIIKLARAEGIAQWKIADKLGVCELTISRWLRHELPEDKRRQIVDAIRELSASSNS